MKRILVVGTLVAATSALMVNPVAAEVAKTARPDALKRLTDCRAIASQAERLSCYDREVAAVDAAEARKDLVVVDREQLNTTRRSLFGLTLPNLSIFGDNSSEAEGVSRLESRIKSVRQTGHGKWIFDLEDGGRWAQIDSKDLPVWPKPGHQIAIRKAALGSYLANVKGQVAIRVERLR